MVAKRKKVAFHTLGCKLNFAETSTISRSFPEEKYERVPASEKADVYIINTCSVTDVADKKCRQSIRKFINRSPEAFIAVVGCYAQLNPQEISGIPGVDLVLGTYEKFDLPEYIENYKKSYAPEVHFSDPTVTEFSSSYSVGDRTRSFLKVQDGCDYGCAYCTIPMARGKSRNPDIGSLVEEARDISERGIIEIVLTGVNIGDFGKSTGESFIDLLKALTKINGIERIRLSSLEPNLISDDLIELVAGSNKLMPHFHIPLQSGNNKILGLMRRRYRVELFAEKMERIKSLIPLAGIGADVIAGFPGENETDFEATRSFIENLPLTYLHVFPYSLRPGTVAAKLPGMVSSSEKERRTSILKRLSESKSLIFKQLNTGKIHKVLFEMTKSDGRISGFTENYLKVEVPWQTRLAGKIATVRISGITESGKLTADILPQNGS
jgi:threonylcarbamoyladenosine tRNA methylthiotransferase MtaB